MKEVKEVIWLKISDAGGFSGISKGTTMADIDKHISDREINKLLGKGNWKKLDEINDENNLTDAAIEFMKSIGWVEKDDFWKSNGDVHAHCFERIEDEKN